MKKLTFAFFTLFLFISCNSDDENKKEIPECLKPVVEAILDMEVQSPKATIERYRYLGREVYQVNAQNFPDGQSFVYELSCEYICPLGGVDGTDNDCEDYSSAEFIEIIWTDPR